MSPLYAITRLGVTSPLGPSDAVLSSLCIIIPVLAGARGERRWAAYVRGSVVGVNILFRGV